MKLTKLVITIVVFVHHIVNKKIFERHFNRFPDSVSRTIGKAHSFGLPVTSSSFLPYSNAGQGGYFPNEE